MLILRSFKEFRKFMLKLVKMMYLDSKRNMRYYNTLFSLTV